MKVQPAFGQTPTVHVERAVDAVLTSPLDGALFVVADQQHLGADDLADPVTATALAAIVAADLGRWRGDLPRRRRWVVTRAAALWSLVARVLADPRTPWWWAPLNRSRQLASCFINPPVPRSEGGLCLKAHRAAGLMQAPSSR